MNTWSAPFHGIQHYPSNTGKPYSPRAFRASVQVSQYGGPVECAVWTPGCGFNPITTKHQTAEEARQHAERQLWTLTKGEMGMPA